MANVNTNLISGGYGPVVGRSREGYPIYLYKDPHTQLINYVVVLPDGRGFYSDPQGHIITGSGNQGDTEAASALVFGAGGWLIGGPIGGILGAIAGAIVGSQVKKKAA